MSTNSLLITGVVLLALGPAAPVAWPVLAVVGLLVITVAAYRAGSGTRKMFAGSLALVTVGSVVIGVLGLLGVGAKGLAPVAVVAVVYVAGAVLGVVALVRFYRELAESQDRWGLAWPLMIVGAAGLVIGLFPQLVPSGVALITLAAFVVGSRRRRLLSWALGVSAVGGLVIMVNYWSVVAGVRSGGGGPWMAVPLVALYYAGWVMGAAGGVALYLEAVTAGRVRGVR